MASGDITASYVGRGLIGTLALTTLMSGINVGAGTAQLMTADVVIVPTGASGELAIFKLARAI